MTHPVVHDGQQPVDRAHDPLHGDAEQQQREGDPEQRVDHAKHLPRGGQRGLLAVTYTWSAAYCLKKVYNFKLRIGSLYYIVSPIVVMTVPEKKKDWPKLQLGMFLVARVTPRWLSLVTAAM